MSGLESLKRQHQKWGVRGWGAGEDPEYSLNGRIGGRCCKREPQEVAGSGGEGQQGTQKAFVTSSGKFRRLREVNSSRKKFEGKDMPSLDL